MGLDTCDEEQLTVEDEDFRPDTFDCDVNEKLSCGNVFVVLTSLLTVDKVSETGDIFLALGAGAF